MSVYLTNPGEQQAKAEAVFSSFKPLTKALARLRDQKPQYQAASIFNMDILKGQYTFSTLYEWKKEVSSKILAMDGVYSSDIDDSQNKLSIGVKDETVTANVNKKLTELNIPREAVRIFHMSPPTLYTSLRDQVPSYLGGIKISLSSTNWCTMGLPVRWRETSSGPFTTGYITASHCTPPVGGGVNGTQFHQPVLSGEFAGTEVRDPLFSSNRCGNTGQNCRESDAALIEYTNLLTPQLVLGSIYKTTSRGHNNGSREIASNNAHLHVKDVNNFIILNSENNKIGAKTGWTYGLVTEICRDFTVSGPTVTTVVCQNVVQAGSDNGDSGAPVFETTADPDSVTFNGILSGGYTDSGTKYFWYSPVTAVNYELSGPNVHDLTFTAQLKPISVSISGDTFINSSGYYTWEAITTNVNGNVNYQWSRRYDGSSIWTNLGTNKTETHFVNIISGTGFDIRVEVQDDYDSDVAQEHVTVQYN